MHLNRLKSDRVPPSTKRSSLAQTKGAQSESQQHTLHLRPSSSFIHHYKNTQPQRQLPPINEMASKDTHNIIDSSQTSKFSEQRDLGC